ncbi:P-loop containing nucleoside triphosphate hydrolase protein [Lipomyces oligophaga]|uniref:P-loop containing nucleoside triphosphate hydrolase protein n=1 Tax=Lipomyces oligophaga TaxID=45792 RepID=UPI0034CF3903
MTEKYEQATEKSPLTGDTSDVAEGSISSRSPSSKGSFFDRFRFSSSSSKAGSIKSYASLEPVDEFACLPEDEAKILRDQVEVPASPASYFTLYRYANSYDQFILLLGLASAMLEGALKPIMAILFGRVTDVLTGYDPSVMYYYNSTSSYNTSYIDTSYYNATYYNETFSRYMPYDPRYTAEPVSADEYYRAIRNLALYLVYIGIGDIVLSHLKTYIFIDRGEVLAARIREHYLAATLRQNIGYFDKLGSGEITSRITADTVLVQEAISEKVAFIVANSTTFVVALIVAFTQSYILTFIMLSVLIGIILSTGAATVYMVKYQQKAQDGYAVGGTLAEEVIGSVRTVQAFGIQDVMSTAYDNFLKVSEYWSIWAGIAVGLMNGTMYLCSFSTDAMAYWQGIRFFVEGYFPVGSIITIIFAVFQGAYAFAIISPYLSALTSGIAAGTKIFATIDRPSAIDSSDESGEKLPDLNGHIELKNIKFIYPSRPNVTILNEFSLDIPAGKTVALVGASGSGKSTIIGLIERFYNPIFGDVFLDGHNIKSLNIKWLRQNIALVQQEPTLFACSIFENIAYGLIGTPFEYAAHEEKKSLIIEACKQANAWDFINSFPEGLDTSVGERGFLMSGGQKQRIAIARAIVGNPKILLLDEATSALDTKSEGVVQEALDRASKNRTTIVIAHRLSTVKDADCIVVMRRGQIMEMGNHSELLAAGGEYHELVKAQQIESLKEKQKAQIENEEKVAAAAEEDGVQLTTFPTNQNQLEPSKTRMTVGGVSVIEGGAMFDMEEQREPTFFEAFKFIYELSRPELFWNVTGIIACFFNGMGYPALGLLWGANLQAISEIYDLWELKRIVQRNAGFLFMLACSLGISNTISGSTFGYSSAKLIRRIRYRSFRQMLRQDISFFDRDENTVGSLTGTLSIDAQSVEGLGGITLGKIVDALMTVVGSCIVSIALAYKFGLVMTASVPVLLGSGFYRFYLLAKFEANAKKENSRTSTFACEATSSIRTVVALTRESDVWEIYHSSLNEMVVRNRPSSLKSGFFYGLCQGSIFFIMALGTWYGGQLLGTGEYSLFQFYLVFMSIVFGAESAGVVFSFAPDMGKAIQASKNIKTLLECKPVVDVWSPEGDIVPEAVEGNIDFKNVHFRYPTRPEVPILRGLDLSVKAGQYVALVGASGCGKSTTIALIEEFYRPTSGQICLDGKDITEFNIAAYREKIALVSQEPTLYAGSIRHNVSLGSPKEVSEEQIVAACRSANIHDFIMSLPDGYETMVGSKGALLSGGQKQRIAIARALVREPKVLLLDEATSALDSESEKVVQAALDAAAKGRTTIAIAHRLSTIQNADVIFVFEAGKVIEKGTHQELLAKNGRYSELVKLQALEGQ